MALIGENQVRNILIFKDYPNHATMAEARNATKGDGFVISADGTAPAAGEEMIVGQVNHKGGITQYKITPSRVTYGLATAGTARVGKSTLISGFGTITAGQLYRVAITISGYGSLSVENEYLKEGFYKAKTGDVLENVIDGLVQSLARNFSRDEPTINDTFTLTKQDATTVKLPQNAYFDFDKTSSNGTAEVSTLTVTAVPTEDGNVLLTLNGTDYYVPVTAAGATTTTTAAEISAWLNVAGNADDYTASPSTNVVTITSAYERVEVAFAEDSNGVAGYAATAATTTPGADGTDLGLQISEKASYLDHYYVTGKKTRLGLNYTVAASGLDGVTVSVVDTVAGTPGKGTGYQVRNMEEYLLGNRQDTFRGAGYPHNFPETYDSELDANYNIIDIEYYDEGRDDAQIRSKKQLTLCVKEAVGTYTKTNLVKDDLNTVIGGSNGVVVNTLS